jgi:hypothetical protein
VVTRVVPLESVPAVVVPVVPAILALSCWIALLSGRRTVFLGNVRSQIRADAAMLRDGGA